MVSALACTRSSAALALAGLLLLASCVARPPPPPPSPDEAAQCLATLAAHGIAFEPVAIPVAANGCGIENGVRVLRTGVAWNQPGVMSCALAARLGAFEREVVQPAALRYFGQPVAELQHFGAFSCRREASSHDRLSQHAKGNAIDIAGFTLADGTRVSVDDAWRQAGREGGFLREVARRACSYFSVVLTPASNARHRNHFHLDIGPYRACEAG